MADATVANTRWAGAAPSRQLSGRSCYNRQACSKKQMIIVIMELK